MKNIKRFFTLPNIVIIVSALFICYRIYAMLPLVEEHEKRLDIIEKKIATNDVETRYIIETLKEVKNNVRFLVSKQIKGDKNEN